MPLRNVAHGPRSDTAIDFVGTRIIGEVALAGEEPRRLDLAFGMPVYLAASMPEALAALPLAPGYAARLTFYDPGRDVFEVVARVVGVDAMAAAGGEPFEAWRVEVDGGAAPMTMWIARESGSTCGSSLPCPTAGRSGGSGC